MKQRFLVAADSVENVIRKAVRIAGWVIPFRNWSLLFAFWALVLAVVLIMVALAVASLFWPSLWISLEVALPVAPGNLLCSASLLLTAMLLLGNFPRMVRSAGWWHRTVIRLIRWSDGGKARRTRVVLILVVAELWLTFGFIAVGGDPQLSKLTGLEWVLEYVKAAAQTFETLLERGKAGPAALQQLVTSHWNVAMVASRAGNDDEMQRALGRAYQLLRAMKENDIPLNSNCEQILAQLEQMLSNNQSQ